MIFRSSHIISLLFLTLIINAQKAPNNSFIIYGGIAHIGNGEIIPKSIIGIDDGTISFVADATITNIDTSINIVIRADGKHVYPGIIAKNTL